MTQAVPETSVERDPGSSPVGPGSVGLSLVGPRTVEPRKGGAITPARVVHSPDLPTGGPSARLAPWRLLTIPARHPYVAAVQPAGALSVRPERVTGFEPDPFFDPALVRAMAGEVDVVHLHFGFDHLDTAHARRWLAVLRALGLPLVLTVHDLRNPHHLDPRAHDAVLAELVPAAAAVITLTESAAAEIRRRFAVTAVVVPHPTLADPDRTADVATEAGLVALHLKSLRRNLLDPVPVVAAAARGAVAAGTRLRVDVHPEVLADPRLAGLAEVPGTDLFVHPRFDDLELERYLRQAQVTVLPHRWGTHSGWLELARDLGTRVVAPSCGYYRDQWSEVVSYRNDEEYGLDVDSLAAAVTDAVRRPILEPADRTSRLAELRAAQDQHAQIYAALVHPVPVRTPLAGTETVRVGEVGAPR